MSWNPNDLVGGFSANQCQNQNINQFLQAMANQSQQRLYQPPPIIAKPEKKSMFKEIATDIKAFILEHRGVIYFIAFALILDHFFFRGAFKARLQSMADKVVTKVEEKIK